jgi:hypothetical protein
LQCRRRNGAIISARADLAHVPASPTPPSPPPACCDPWMPASPDMIYALWPASVLVLRCLFPGWANWLSSWTRWLTADRPPRPSQRASAWCEVCVVSGFLTRYYSVNSPDPATSDICLARRAGFTREDLALGVCVGFLGHTSAGRIRRQAEGAVCSHACA